MRDVKEQPVAERVGGALQRRGLGFAPHVEVEVTARHVEVRWMLRGPAVRRVLPHHRSVRVDRALVIPSVRRAVPHPRERLHVALSPRVPLEVEQRQRALPVPLPNVLITFLAVLRGRGEARRVIAATRRGSAARSL